MGTTPISGYRYPDAATTLSSYPLDGAAGAFGTPLGELDGRPYIDLTFPGIGGAPDDSTDNSPAIAAAFALLAPTGGYVILPGKGKGIYRHSQPVNPPKFVHLLGDGSGINNAGVHAATMLRYTGAAAAQVQLTGLVNTATIMEGIALDNIGSATVAVDVNNTQSVKVIDVGSLAPTVPYSVAGVRIGATANTVDTLLRDVVMQTAAPIGLDIIQASADVVCDHVRLPGNTVNAVSIGSPTTTTEGVWFRNGCTFEMAAANLTCILIAGQVLLVDIEGEFEYGGTGRALLIPASALIAEQVNLRNSLVNPKIGSVSSYLVECGLGSATVNILDNEILGLPNTGAILHNVAVGHATIRRNRLNSSAGVAVADSLTHVDHSDNYVNGSAAVIPAYDSAAHQFAVGIATQAITSGALPTVAPISGTGLQILTTRDTQLALPVTLNPSGANTATVAIALSPDGVTYSTVGTETIPSNANAWAGIIRVLNVAVPAGWFVKFTATNATLGTGTYY